MLRPGTIHVLHADLEQPPVSLDALLAAVSPDERARAARFRDPKDRLRHLIGRALARIVLARELGSEPAALAFRYTRLGKPYLPDGPSFSISHSGRVVLLACALEGRLGADVETVRVPRDLMKLARRSFVAEEVAAIAALPPEERLRPFFRTWSRKEALLKALGSGIRALREIAVSAQAGVENAVLRVPPPEEAASWRVRSVACDPSAEAAVAWDRPLLEVSSLVP